MIDNRKCELLQKRVPSERYALALLKELGYRVIAQYPIRTRYKTYYADLYIPSLRLVIEIDGGYHFNTAQKKKDALRAQNIRRTGRHVYRLRAADVYHRSKVIAKLNYFHRLNSKKQVAKE